MNPAPWYSEIPSATMSQNGPVSGMWRAETNGALVRRDHTGKVLATVGKQPDGTYTVHGLADALASSPTVYARLQAVLSTTPQWATADWTPPGVGGMPPKIPLLALIDAALVEGGRTVESRQGRSDNEAVLRAAFSALSNTPGTLPPGRIRVAYSPEPGVFIMSLPREGEWELVARPQNVGHNALRCKISNNEWAEIRRTSPRGTKYVMETFNANGDRVTRIDPKRTLEDAIAVFKRDYGARVQTGLMATAPSTELAAKFGVSSAASIVSEGAWHLNTTEGATLYSELEGVEDWAVQIEVANDRAVSASLVDAAGRTLVDVMGSTPAVALRDLQTRAKEKGIRNMRVLPSIPDGILAKFIEKTKFIINNDSPPQEKTMSEVKSTFAVVKDAYSMAAVGKAVTAAEKKILDIVKSKLRQAYPTLPDHEGYDRLILTMIPIAVRELASRAPESIPEKARQYAVKGADCAIFFDAVRNVDDLGNMLGSVAGEVLEMVSGIGQMATMAEGGFAMLDDKSGVVDLEARSAERSKSKEKVRAAAASGDGS